jgi:hypothetical protein
VEGTGFHPDAPTDGAGRAGAVGEAAFIAEVGQSHQNAIDLVAILLEQFRALARILESLNSNQRRPARSRFE